MIVHGLRVLVSYEVFKVCNFCRCVNVGFVTILKFKKCAFCRCVNLMQQGGDKLSVDYALISSF